MNEEVFEDLVNLYLDKEISPQQLEILRSELDNNPVRAEVFRSYCRMHQASHLAALHAAPVIPTRRPLVASGSQGHPIRTHHLGWTALAAAVVLAAFIWVYLSGPFAKSNLPRFADGLFIENDQTNSFLTSDVNVHPNEFYSVNSDKRTISSEKVLESWLITQERDHWQRSAGAKSNQDMLIETPKPGDEVKFQYSNYEFKR